MVQLIIGSISIELEKKSIKNMYIRILPPDGRVHVSAPYRMKEERIRCFVESKLEWIKTQQDKMRQRNEGEGKEYISGEEIPIWGKQYKLQVKEYYRKNCLEVDKEDIILYAGKKSSAAQRSKILETWYRKSMSSLVPPFLLKWENIIGVKSSGFIIRDMKTRWGTCNIRTGRICLNLQLAKKHPQYLEYVIVHELVHLLEGSHNYIFKGYMDQFLPQWRTLRKELNGKTSAF